MPEGGGEAESQEQAGAFAYRHIAANLERLDLNQLQTALATAIAAEDYALAGAVRDRLAALAEADGAGGDVRSRLLDWGALGVTDWVADRAARLGLRFPTGERVRWQSSLGDPACAVPLPVLTLNPKP